MFKFDFALEDVDDAFSIPSPPSERAATNSRTADSFQPFEEVSISHLLDALPSLISYSPLSIPLSSRRHITLPRRDLFDARFQLISEEGDNVADENSTILQFLDAPSDLVPGLYEGGLKTWECSLDLVDYLDSMKDSSTYEPIQGKRVIEIGCGTAVPTLYLLFELFSSPPPEDSSANETSLHLQDYNSSVLELVSFPNILLTWYMSQASASYRESATGPSDNTSTPNSSAFELSITPELQSAFLASLGKYKISLHFFAGSWDTFDLRGAGGKYDIVLTSETIYRMDSLLHLIALLQKACGVAEETLEDLASSKLSISPAPPPSVPSYICLVAAKVLYFGVGGGVSEFTQAVEGPENSKNKRGKVKTIWERNIGVGRRIMQIWW